ncbi:MAG: hypothetical protein AAFQ47_06895 [Pseudomonadota bacterium]
MLVYLDHSDIKKTRRALLIASITLLIAASLSFQTDVLSVFGLEIRISNVHMVEIIRLFVGYFLIVFLLRSALISPRYLLRWKRRSDDLWEKGFREQIEEIEREADPRYDGYDPDPWYIDLSDGVSQRALSRAKWIRIAKVFNRFLVFLMEWAFIVVIAAIAIRDPNLLRDYLTSIE